MRAHLGTGIDACACTWDEPVMMRSMIKLERINCRVFISLALRAVAHRLHYLKGGVVYFSWFRNGP